MARPETRLITGAKPLRPWPGTAAAGCDEAWMVSVEVAVAAITVVAAVHAVVR